MLRRTTPRLAAALACAVALSSCIASRRPIVLDSTPAGANVYIDGVDSGHSTPCHLQLSDSRRTVEFRLDGFQPATREMRVGNRSRVVYWRDAALDLKTWPFPLWLGTEDFFFPVKQDSGEMPHRIHVRLVRQREPLALAR